MRQAPYCHNTWRPIDTEYSDQSVDPAEGSDCVKVMRWMGLIPREAPEPVLKDWSEPGLWGEMS